MPEKPSCPVLLFESSSPGQADERRFLVMSQPALPPDYIVMRALEPELNSHATPDVLTSNNWEIVNKDCFKPSSFGGFVKQFRHLEQLLLLSWVVAEGCKGQNNECSCLAKLIIRKMSSKCNRSLNTPLLTLRLIWNSSSRASSKPLSTALGCLWVNPGLIEVQ